MRPHFAAALILAAGVIAAPSFAAETPAPAEPNAAGTSRGVRPVAPAPAPAPAETNAPPMAKSGTMHTTHAMHTMHHPMVHHAMGRMAKTPEQMRTDQLNNMSLQAAKKGESFSPPAAPPPGTK